jgi:hypothetical protein
MTRRLISSGSTFKEQIGYSRAVPRVCLTALQGIDNAEIIETVHARRQPMTPVHASTPH